MPQAFVDYHYPAILEFGELPISYGTSLRISKCSNTKMSDDPEKKLISPETIIHIQNVKIGMRTIRHRISRRQPREVRYPPLTDSLEYLPSCITRLHPQGVWRRRLNTKIVRKNTKNDKKSQK